MQNHSKQTGFKDNIFFGQSGQKKKSPKQWRNNQNSLIYLCGSI
jgi:hypothetical protein